VSWIVSSSVGEENREVQHHVLAIQLYTKGIALHANHWGATDLRHRMIMASSKPPFISTEMLAGRGQPPACDQEMAPAKTSESAFGKPLHDESAQRLIAYLRQEQFWKHPMHRMY